MTATVSLVRLRGATLVRAVGALLVLLVVSPVSEPFSTFALADLGGETPLHGQLLSSAKTVKDGSTLHVLIVPAQPTSFDGLPVESPLVDYASTRPAPPLVLRL